MLPGGKRGICFGAGGSCGRPEQLRYVWIIRWRDSVQGESDLQRVAAKPRGLCRAAFLECYALDGRRSSRVHWNRVLEAVQHLIGGVRQAGVGLVQLAGRLGRQLAELVAIGNVGECSKDKI